MKKFYFKKEAREKKVKRAQRGKPTPRRLKKKFFFLRNVTRNLEAGEAKKNRISNNPEKKKKKKTKEKKKKEEKIKKDQ